MCDFVFFFFLVIEGDGIFLLMICKKKKNKPGELTYCLFYFWLGTSYLLGLGRGRRMLPIFGRNWLVPLGQFCGMLFRLVL